MIDMERAKLTATKTIEIRFNEVDSMGVVWHGHYATFFEDAREEFGRKYDLGYLMMYDKGYFEPLVELSFKYKKPLVYGMKPEITITYCPCESAKILFDYEIRDPKTKEVFATGHSEQVFMDKTNYQLVLYAPEFYDEWRRRWEVNL